jgi:regulator of extracellular matrix RemA (YlzA/DUF370 family)
LKNELLKIGYSNYVPVNKIMSIISPDSAPVKRLVKTGKKDGNVIDATHGRKTKSVIVLENKQLVLSAVNTDKLAERFYGITAKTNNTEEE